MKPPITENSILEWKENSWQEYASTTIWASNTKNGRRLRFLCNYKDNYWVLYGGETIYKGSSIKDAIKAWDEV